MADVTLALAMHDDALRQQLREWMGSERGPEIGSDADLLVEALCGAAPDLYLPRFEASGRALAEQGARIETRLAALQRWNGALAHAIDEFFADDPETQARAQEFLGSLIAQATTTLARGYETVRLAKSVEDAEHARRGASRLRAFQRVNAAANSTLDIDQTLITTARAVVEEMNADLCVIFLFDETTRELQLRATSGPLPYNSSHYTVPLGHGYTGWVAEHGRPLQVSDVSADTRFNTEAGAYPEPMRGLLSVPIIFFTVEKLEGVISVQTREPRAFTDEDVAFLEVVAGQLAMGLENGRLFEQNDEELRRKVHELSTLHRVSALVASSLVLDNVLRQIVAQAVLLSGADRSVLFELDGVTEQLRAVATHGFESSEVTRAAIRVGQCCAGRVLRTGEPSMSVDCMRADGGCFLRNAPEAVGDQHSVLCAPLVTVHGPLGALCVFSSQRHMLNMHQLQLVMTFANVAAIAMENARLFEQTREGLRTKETLLREMHHRVKNNLQQVASILSMQRRRARQPEVEQVLGETVDRIQGIAATHDLLSNTELGMARIDEIARKIADIVRSNMAPPHLRLSFRIGQAPYNVPSEQATTLAIIINELVSNAIEHGFEDEQRTRGTISISGARESDQLVMRVADDGQGPPSGFSLQTADSLGLQLVRTLMRSDLRGTVELFRAAGAPEIGGSEVEANGSSGSHPKPDLSTDPRLSATQSTDVGTAGARDGAQSEPQIWTVVELRFPAVLPVAATSNDVEQTEPSVAFVGD